MLRLVTTRRQGARDEGAIAVISVIFFVVVMGLGAIVVDFGLIAAERRQAQRAADLAATAAAQDLYTSANIDQTAEDYTTANGWSGAPDVTVDGDRVTVVTSVEDVPLLFFPGLRALLGDEPPGQPPVRARATAEVRSPRGAGLLPVFVPASQTAGSACLKAASVGQTEECPGPDTGNFQWADINRTENPGNLVDNLWFGAEFDATIATGQISDQPCSGSFVDSAKVTKETAPFDCLSTKTGNITSAALDGLYTTQGNRCEGRLAVMVDGSCTVSPNRWAEYNGDPEEIDPEIFSDPRFGYTPRLGVELEALTGSTEAYPIVGFYGTYITGIYRFDTPCDDGSCSQINVITAELFELDDLATIIGSGSGVGTVTYLGSGTRVIRLVE